MGFDPKTFVIMADKTLKRVENLEYGDKVSCGNNQFATVHKVQSVNFYQPFQMCNYFGVILTARSVVRHEEQEWKYFCELTTDHTTCPIIMQIELDSIHEIVCEGYTEIICMTKNHKCDFLIYDAVVTDNSSISCVCANNCVIEGKVFQSHCGTIDYCPLCVPIIHFAVSSVSV
jgi:hypothetical protein